MSLITDSNKWVSLLQQYTAENVDGLTSSAVCNQIESNLSFLNDKIYSLFDAIEQFPHTKKELNIFLTHTARLIRHCQNSGSRDTISTIALKCLNICETLNDLKKYSIAIPSDLYHYLESRVNAPFPLEHFDETIQLLLMTYRQNSLYGFQLTRVFVRRLSHAFYMQPKESQVALPKMIEFIQVLLKLTDFTSQEMMQLIVLLMDRSKEKVPPEFLAKLIKDTTNPTSPFFYSGLSKNLKVLRPLLQCNSTIREDLKRIIQSSYPRLLHCQDKDFINSYAHFCKKIRRVDKTILSKPLRQFLSQKMVIGSAEITSVELCVIAQDAPLKISGEMDAHLLRRVINHYYASKKIPAVYSPDEILAVLKFAHENQNNFLCNEMFKILAQCVGELAKDDGQIYSDAAFCFLEEIGKTAKELNSPTLATFYKDRIEQQKEAIKARMPTDCGVLSLDDLRALNLLVILFLELNNTTMLEMCFDLCQHIEVKTISRHYDRFFERLLEQTKLIHRIAYHQPHKRVIANWALSFLVNAAISESWLTYKSVMEAIRISFSYEEPPTVEKEDEGFVLLDETPMNRSSKSFPFYLRLSCTAHIDRLFKLHGLPIVQLTLPVVLKEDFNFKALNYYFPRAKICFV